jgi:drug/metabolite transporter (DMT)-like permease
MSAGLQVGVGRIAAVFAGSILSLSVANILLKIACTPAAVGTYAANVRWWAGTVGMVLMILQFAGMLLVEYWGMDVSVVMPVFGLNFAVTAILGRVFLGEGVDFRRWLGIVILTFGVYLVASSQRGGKP